MFKNLNKNLVLSWVFAIAIGIAFEIFLIFILPANSPHLWIKWMALPIVYLCQKLILNALNNPSEIDDK